MWIFSVLVMRNDLVTFDKFLKKYLKFLKMRCKICKKEFCTCTTSKLSAKKSCEVVKKFSFDSKVSSFVPFDEFLKPEPPAESIELANQQNFLSKISKKSSKISNYLPKREEDLEIVVASAPFCPRCNQCICSCSHEIFRRDSPLNTCRSNEPICVPRYVRPECPLPRILECVEQRPVTRNCHVQTISEKASAGGDCCEVIKEKICVDNEVKKIKKKKQNCSSSSSSSSCSTMGFSGDTTCAKYLLCTFNFIFFLLGMLILALGLWLLIDRNSIISLIKRVNNDFRESELVNRTIYIILAIGTIKLILGFFGCCGAIRRSHCLLSFYGVLMIVLLTVEIIGFIIVFVSTDMGCQQSLMDYLKVNCSVIISIASLIILIQLLNAFLAFCIL